MDLNTDINLFNQPPETKSFHNTVEAKEKELDIYEGKAKGQEKAVKEFFEERPNEKYLSDSVWKILIGRKIIHEKTPYISIRRACSNLKKKGTLIMLDEMVMGDFGSPAHYYELNKDSLNKI